MTPAFDPPRGQGALSTRWIRSKGLLKGGCDATESARVLKPPLDVSDDLSVYVLRPRWSAGEGWGEESRAHLYQSGLKTTLHLVLGSVY